MYWRAIRTFKELKQWESSLKYLSSGERNEIEEEMRDYIATYRKYHESAEPSLSITTGNTGDSDTFAVRPVHGERKRGRVSRAYRPRREIV
jgi:hypothetical protein